jgi:lipopolysaccharide/colanic/teichoic acid biosynthesis glycosyltransferase
MLSEHTGEQALVIQSAASRRYLAVKRVVDVTLAAIAIILLSPLLALIALGIRLTSSGPAIYRQTRIGRLGRPFVVYKFRTMYQDADPVLHQRYIEAYAHNYAHEVAPGMGEPYAPYKMVHDPRITPFGRYLRRTSLDELPQLFNVLRGEMSLVGPRPDVPYSVALYKDWHKQRLAVHPGITGLWQIRGRGRVSYEEGMRLDCEYVQRQSLWLDLEILLLTIPAVLSMRGAA